MCCYTDKSMTEGIWRLFLHQFIVGGDAYRGEEGHKTMLIPRYEMELDATVWVVSAAVAQRE